MNESVSRRQKFTASTAEAGSLLTREWLVTNGRGGYASGTVGGACTRRYHGLLIAALPNPLGRTVMLCHLWEELRLPTGDVIRLGGEEHVGSLEEHGAQFLTEFRLEAGLPIWRYEAGGIVLERRVWLAHKQNTTYINYRLLSGESTARLTLRPAVNFRAQEAPVSQPLAGPYALTCVGDRFELSLRGDLPPLRLRVLGENRSFSGDAKTVRQLLYRMEASRGYESEGELWSPGLFHANLSRDHDATLVASTEPWETALALEPAEALGAEYERRERLLAIADPRAREGVAAELVLAADQFIVSPAGRREGTAWARAAGDEFCSVIAGYHWFLDWGRDTMISLEGLTLVTGRHTEAGFILRMFARYLRDGLLPNMFPEGQKEGLYHTADATLWFFHALRRYVDHTGDRLILRHLLPKLLDVIDHHLRGTRFNIRVDPEDGLLSQGAEGCQLTWMDAKVGDWVVTPRRGKAVEINALWYNALRLLEDWVREERGEEAARPLAEHAERARKSFNDRFWYAEGGHLYDVVDGEDGDDPACRPNQVLAIALDHPVLDQQRWESVLGVICERLLTPVGLRSLAPEHPEYEGKYVGDVHARDAAYHQGTVWPWLIGPCIDAWLKTHPDDRAGARGFLEMLVPQLDEACIGSISEILGAEAPFTPRGCVAQAWSVAEVLRCWIRTT